MDKSGIAGARGAYDLNVLFVYGCPTGREDALDLVALLLEEGSDVAVEAAGQIQHALLLDRVVVGLTPAQRDVTLDVLDDARLGLGQLRESLTRDYDYRHERLGESRELQP